MIQEIYFVNTVTDSRTKNNRISANPQSHQALPVNWFENNSLNDRNCLVIPLGR